jgi:hypothetical protein
MWTWFGKGRSGVTPPHLSKRLLARSLHCSDLLFYGLGLFLQVLKVLLQPGNAFLLGPEVSLEAKRPAAAARASAVVSSMTRTPMARAAIMAASMPATMMIPTPTAHDLTSSLYKIMLMN